MHRSRQVFGVVGLRETGAELPGAVPGGVVLAFQVRQTLPHRRRQCLERGVHVAEPGVAGTLRHLDAVEHARIGREVVIRHVGVPFGLAGPEAADRLAVDDDRSEERRVGKGGVSTVRYWGCPYTYKKN